MNITAQCCALIAFIFFVSSVQAKKKKNLILMQFVSNTMYAVNYYLLNVKMACYTNLLSALRCIILYSYDGKKPPKIFLYILLLIILFLGVTYYDGLISLIPIFAVILYTVSTWQDNMKFIRVLYIVASLLWVYYNYTFGAYAAMAGNCFEIISGIISLIRFRKKKQDI